MTRQRMGWGLVLAAGVLLVLQLIPFPGPRGGGRAAKVPTRVSHSPTDPGATGSVAYPRPRRLKAGDLVLFSRSASRNGADAAGPLYAQYWEPGRGEPVVIGDAVGLAGGAVSQSPDGHMVRVQDTVFRDTANPQGLGRLISGAGLTGYTWREDSQALCALQPETDTDFVVEILLAGPVVEARRWPLPQSLRPAGQGGPLILSCTATRHALVAHTGLDGAVQGFDVDLATGQAVPRLSLGPGTADALVGSRDGTLVALNLGGDGPRRSAATHSMVREVGGGKVVLDLGQERRVLAFSGDGAEVLVAPNGRAGAQLVRLSDGKAMWTEQEGRVVLGWLARPRSGELMVAMGRRELNTCTKGEPGKFPEFCRFEPLQELLRVDSGGNVTHQLGAAVGAWEYAVP